MSLSPEINAAGDDDSLFGSPPSSPTRGRSPSPLALPSGPAQNVGTLALPGSHLVAELPVTPPESLPLTASAPAPSRQPPPRPPSRVPLQSIGSSSRRNSARAESAPRKSRKGKEKEKSSASRPIPYPLPLPVGDETVPPNFLRNHHALLGLAGMVGGVTPANLPKPRDTRGATAEDPIVVEEEPLLPQHPSIGKRPVRAGPSDPSQLPRPTSEQILGSLLQQKNVFPVVVSLLRLLAPGAPSLSSVPPAYPCYPYPQQSPPAQSTPAFWTRSQSPEQAAGPSAPPLKRRKLNTVPAGAADWDVPYPFQEGQGPENYRMTWERERGKQLLADLVQLVKGAAQKAATKTWYQQQQAQRRYYGRGVVVGYGSEPTVNKYYRPKTMYYGLERGPVASQRPFYPYPSGPYTAPTSGTSTPTAGVACGSDAGLPDNPLSSASPHDEAQASPEVPQVSPTAFDQLVESLLSAQQQQSQQVADTPVASASTPPANSASSPTAPSSLTAEDNTQALFDNWLEMLTAFPPGDPNEGAAASPTSPTSPADGGATSSRVSTEPSTSPDMVEGVANANESSHVPDCLIDPALLDLAFSDIAGANPTTSTGASTFHPVVSSTTVVNSDATAAAPTPANSSSAQSATPSLVDSPTVTIASLPDPADAGPATPTWDWTFPGGHEETTADMKKTLEEWAGMDIDVDMGAIIDEQLASVVPTPAVEPSSSTGAPAVPRVDVGTQSTAHVDPELPQPHAPMQSHPSLTQEDALRQGLGAQDVSRPTSEHATAGMTPQPSLSIPPSNTLPCLHATAQLPAATALGVLSTPFVSSVAHAMAASARAKGKAKAIPGTGNGVGTIPTPGAGAGAKQERKAILARARKMRAALAAEVERAKVALWETTLEQGVLVGFGRELEKERQAGSRR